MTNEGRWGPLRGGGDPDWESEENDPAKLADLIGRNQIGTTHVDGCDGTAGTRGPCCWSRDDRIAAALTALLTDDPHRIREEKQPSLISGGRRQRHPVAWTLRGGERS
jgi:hypothetical protein